MDTEVPGITEERTEVAPCDHVCVSTPAIGEYMLHGSDSEDSFTDDGEEEEEGRGRGAEGEGGGGEGEGERILPSLPSGPTISGGGVEGEGRGGEGDKEGSGVSDEEKGDPEMAPIFLKKMLPVFAELFHSSLAPTLRYIYTFRK